MMEIGINVVMDEVVLLEIIPEETIAICEHQNTCMEETSLVYDVLLTDK